jgi:CRP-like cAMP-binding protein
MALATSAGTVNADQNQLLAAMSADDFKKFFSTLRRVRLEQKRVLYEAGSPIAEIYFMESGVASIITTMSDGASVEVGMVGSEGMVGMPLLLGAALSPHQAVIQIGGDAVVMKASDCLLAFEQSASVQKPFLKFFESLFDLGAQTAACNVLHSIEQRCARWLLMSSDRARTDYLILTQEYVAAMLGVRRASVTEVAGTLQRAGLIEYHSGRITILDREALAASACECYALDRDRLTRLSN